LPPPDIEILFKLGKVLESNLGKVLESATYSQLLVYSLNFQVKPAGGFITGFIGFY